MVLLLLLIAHACIHMSVLAGPGPAHNVAKRSWCDTMVSTQNWFKCKDGQNPWCISPYLMCDNTKNCKDGSDEVQSTCDGMKSVPSATHRSESTMCTDCSDFERALLNTHNDLRRTVSAANMNEVQWSKSAADQALRWAKECNDGSSPHGMMDPDYGQNVGRSYYTTRPSDDHFLTVIVTKGWFNERSIYDPNTNKCTTSDGNGCGHFKTMATGYLREMGCGLTYCPDGKFWNLVCDYRPWPEWKTDSLATQETYVQGQSCTKCQPGLQCRNNLCA